MPQRVLVIGIDSMDSAMVNKYINYLPTIKELMSSNSKIKLTSVFPPDSDTAWASVYTGLSPSKHGVVNFIDPLKKSIEIQTVESESKNIAGKTFWDYAGERGKKVCILLPHIAFPPWNINGIMVSRSRIEDKIESKPLIFEDRALINLNTPKGVPKKDAASLENLIYIYKKLILNETNFFKEMILNESWDLFFCYSSALDAIQHYFWNHCNENNSENNENAFSGVIREFYVLYDRMIKNLINSVNNEVAVLILSDHGHGGRPTNLININQLLYQKGFIYAKQENIFNSALGGLKDKSLELISKNELGWIASKILKLFPSVKKVYSSPSYIDLANSKAYATDLSGIKAYTYGGIIINKNSLGLNDYESIRDKIILMLNEEIGSYIEWIALRETIYSGKYIYKYPDILIQLKEGYGLGNKIKVPLFTKTYTSNIVPGSHRGETPVFILHHADRATKKTKIELIDIAPTIMDLLGIRYLSLGFEGKSIFENTREDN